MDHAQNNKEANPFKTGKNNDILEVESGISSEPTPFHWNSSNSSGQFKFTLAPLNSALLDSFLNVSWSNASRITGLWGLRNAGLLIPC